MSSSERARPRRVARAASAPASPEVAPAAGSTAASPVGSPTATAGRAMLAFRAMPARNASSSPGPRLAPSWFQNEVQALVPVANAEVDWNVGHRAGPMTNQAPAAASSSASQTDGSAHAFTPPNRTEGHHHHQSGRQGHRSGEQV